MRPDASSLSHVSRTLSQSPALAWRSISSMARSVLTNVPVMFSCDHIRYPASMNEIARSIDRMWCHTGVFLGCGLWNCMSFLHHGRNRPIAMAAIHPAKVQMNALTGVSGKVFREIVQEKRYAGTRTVSWSQSCRPLSLNTMDWSMKYMAVSMRDHTAAPSAGMWLNWMTNVVRG